MLFLLSLVSYARRREAIRRDAGVMLGALAALAAFGMVDSGHSRFDALVQELGAVLLLAQPALLLRLVAYFHRVPWGIAAVAVVGVVVAAAAEFGIGLSLPPPLGLSLLAWFVYLQIYCVSAFTRAALRKGGAARRRMVAVAVGTALLAATLLVALFTLGQHPAGGAAAVEAEVVQGMLLLVGACYYCGFTPPPWLRRLWQMPDVYEFVISAPLDPESTEDTLAALAHFALKVTGARAAAIGVPRRDAPGLTLRWWGALPGAPLADAMDEPVTGALGRAWAAGESGLAGSPGDMSPAGRQLAEAIGAQALLAVPIGGPRGPEGRLGLLAVFADGGWLFPGDDLAHLDALARHAAVVLANQRLLADAKAAADRLRQANAELEQASRAKSEFLASMSHELRTPLNAILGFSELLLDDDGAMDGETGREFLANVHNAGRHLLELINDVLDLAKVEAGRMTLRSELVALEQAVGHALRGLEPIAAKAGVTMVAPAGWTGRLRADPVKLQQILNNLLSNAIKFTPRGGRVTVEVRSGEQVVEITVADTGVGIAPADQAKLFRPFEQLGDEVRRREGTGLGLALTRRLVELHGGTIGVESAPGAGSRFAFSLPLAAAADASAPAPAQVPPGVARRASTPRERPLVLVVEDDAATARLLAAHLSRGGYDAEVAGDGVTALRLARGLQPDAITLDVLLPRLDGWDVLRALKGDAQTRDIPVLVATVVDDPHTAYALGAVDCLLKPVDGRRVVAWLDRTTGPGGRLPAAAPPTILVADDDPQARLLLQEMLRPSGARVLAAEDGPSVLERAQSQRPDVILLDLMLPGLDGFEALERLRSAPETREIPVLVVTGRDLSADDKRALSRQAVAVLHKGTFGRVELLAWVDYIVRGTAGAVPPRAEAARR